jgi:hypothetical protein
MCKGRQRSLKVPRALEERKRRLVEKWKRRKRGLDIFDDDSSDDEINEEERECSPPTFEPCSRCKKQRDSKVKLYSICKETKRCVELLRAPREKQAARKIAFAAELGDAEQALARKKKARAQDEMTAVQQLGQGRNSKTMVGGSRAAKAVVERVHAQARNKMAEMQREIEENIAKMRRQLDEKRARERRQREEDKARRRQRVKVFKAEKRRLGE